MAIAQVCAGAYLSSYNGFALTGGNPTGAGVGFMDDNGYEIEQQTHGEMVDRSDLYGQSLLDWVHQGGSVFITFTCMTFRSDPNLIKAVFYPWSGTGGQGVPRKVPVPGDSPGLGNVGGLGLMANNFMPIGRLASNVASPLILTAVLNTPAQLATTGPATITAPYCILPPGSNLRLMYTTKTRKVPCRLAVLPQEYFGGGSPHVSWWSET